MADGAMPVARETCPIVSTVIRSPLTSSALEVVASDPYASSDAPSGGGMNIKRITYGGLAAALVMIVGELAVEPLLGSTTERFFTRLGLPMPGETAMLALVLTLI